MALTMAAVDKGAAMPRKRDFREKLLVALVVDNDVVVVAPFDAELEDCMDAVPPMPPVLLLLPLVCIRTLIVSNGSIE